VLKTRIIVALIFLPVFVWLVLLANPWYLFGFALAGLSIAIVEFGRMIQHRKIPFRWWVTVPFVLGMCLVAAFSKQIPGTWPTNVLAIFWLAGMLAIMLLGIREILSGFRAETSFPTISGGLLSVFVLGGIGTFLFLLRLMPHGSYWWLILFGFNWIYDASALFSGKYFGRHALAPTISPAKTWEGMLGGLLTNILVAVVVYYTWFPKELGFSLLGFVALGFALGVLSQVGDLIESMLKRWSGMKDASGIIPGHGGILDKIDNLCFTTPVLFGVAWWLMPL
jgi:phosphatidate cytidylyltransferase